MARVRYNTDSFYDPGIPGRIKEDGVIDSFPFVGVVDAYSAPHSREVPPILFDELTGGQMVRSIILDAFVSAPANLSLEKVAIEANKEICRHQVVSKPALLKEPGRWAGASFALAKIKEDEEVVEILQGGDCYTFWLGLSGLGFTKNIFYPYEKELRTKIADLMAKHNKNREEMLVEFCPYLVQKRAENANKKYAVLNGQSEVEKLWQKTEIPLAGLKFLLFFSDGLVHFNWVRDQLGLAKMVLANFNEGGGFRDIIKLTRNIEESEAGQSHETFAEATGLVIWFK